MRWRLYRSHFGGAGRYRILIGDRAIDLNVDQDGTFELDGYPMMWAFAALVGSERDEPYGAMR